MLFEHPEFDDHERVVFVNDRASGLRAIVALHSTALGPAAGGCRLWSYPNSDAALTDALRLSRGMTLKNAAADLPLGGGKAVVLEPPGPFDRQAFMEAFGRAVEGLGGAYWTAEDVGTSVADMAAAGRHTRYVAGRRDPSPYTARGVVACLRAAALSCLGKAELRGLRVAVQGLGHVGGRVAELLAENGATLVLADLDEAKAQEFAHRLDAMAVPTAEVHAAAVDVFAPCALGGVLDARTIPAVRARLVCGAANNQLATPEDAARLQAAGITYAPDFIVNAGGICSVAAEILGIDDPRWLESKLEGLGRPLCTVLDSAAASGRTPEAEAEALARDRIAAGRRT